MRVLILALSVLGILASADAVKAGPSTINRDLSASVDPASLPTRQLSKPKIDSASTRQRVATCSVD